MKLRLEDLPSQLTAASNNAMLPIYIVGGDEPLQVGEACHAIRHQAHAQGYNERHVLHVDKSFDWQSFYAISNSYSLFSDRQLIELRIPTAKPGDKGAKALVQYAQNPPEDSLLLVILGKVDQQTQRSKWFSALDKQGCFVPIWPVEAGRLPAWVNQRMRNKGMQPTPAAVQLLVDRVEGNLLAAAQEIDKLFLLFGDKSIDEQAVIESVADSARFDIYSLVDVALLGDVNRVTRMMDGLKAEGAETVLTLWALTREIRAMHAMALKVAAGSRVEQVVAQGRVWAKRKQAVTDGLKRHKPQNWELMLQQSCRTDRIIKGVSSGNVWNELLQLTLMMAGIRLFKTSAVS